MRAGFTTPVEEILRGMDDLLRQGKILHVAISNAPAWQDVVKEVAAELGRTPAQVGLA